MKLSLLQVQWLQFPENHTEDFKINFSFPPILQQDISRGKIQYTTKNCDNCFFSTYLI